MEQYEYASCRDFIGPALVELAGQNSRIAVVDADLASSVTTHLFQKAYPDRFFEMGIAEQSCMGVATGLASEGMIPFFASMAMFTAGTAWTQLRQACYARRNIKVIGSHAGVDDGPDGASHHACEDLALTRTIPGLTVMTPGDKWELIAAIQKAAEINGPVYLRVPRDNTPILHAQGCDFVPGKAELLRDAGDDFAIVYEGAAAGQAAAGYDLLQQQGARGKLVALRTVKPLDTALLTQLAQAVRVIITVENHSILGGVGGAVAEVLAELQTTAVLRRVGILDVFTESGKIADIKQKYKLTAEQVALQYADAAK